jgi:hypothetical protein
MIDEIIKPLFQADRMDALSLLGLAHEKKLQVGEYFFCKETRRSDYSSWWRAGKTHPGWWG